MTTPRDFFEIIVKPSYQACLSDPLTEWKAKAAASNADTMAERTFVYWDGRDQTQIAGAASARQYRNHIRGICPDFGLDLDNGSKRTLAGVMQAVMAMWESQLASMAL